MKSVINFNGKELPDYVIVTDIDFPVMPDVSPIRNTVPRFYGELDAGNQIKGGKFQFSFKIVPKPSQNLYDLVDDFKLWLIGDNYQESKLIFREQPNKYYLAKVDGSINMKDLFLYGEGSFSMSASRLIKYETIETTSKGTSNLKVAYAGGLNTGFILSIKLLEAHSNVIITSKQQNKSIKLLGEFPTGTVLEIDTVKKLVKMNNQNNMKIIALESRWMELQKGINDIEVKSQKNQIKNELSIKYINKW